MFTNKFNYLSNYHNFISEKHNNNKNLDVLCYFNKYQYLVQYCLTVLMFLSMVHDEPCDKKIEKFHRKVTL